MAVGGFGAVNPGGSTSSTKKKTYGSAAGSANSISVGAKPMSQQDALNAKAYSSSYVQGQGHTLPKPALGQSYSPLSSGVMNGVNLGGASAGGGGGQLPPVAYSPQEMNITSQQNPQLAALQGDAAKYRQGLAAGSDQDAVLALQRQRDLTSGMAKEFAGDAASRGILGSGAAQSDLMKRVVNPGQQQMGALNANLASDARSKQLQALQGEAGMAGQQAGITQAQQNFGLQSWQAKDQSMMNQAQLQVQQQANQVNQASQLAGLLGNFYSGF